MKAVNTYKCRLNSAPYVLLLYLLLLGPHVTCDHGQALEEANSGRMLKYITVGRNVLCMKVLVSGISSLPITESHEQVNKVAHMAYTSVSLDA